jgi:WD40 repeat protein
VTTDITTTDLQCQGNPKYETWKRCLSKFIPKKIGHSGQPWHVFDAPSSNKTTAMTVTHQSEYLITALQ